jgi:hypothetical protein
VDATATTTAAGARDTVPWLAGEILRDIARGGLAGLVVGLLGVGLGGRLVMRLTALLVPESVGSFTENGNRIGDITLGGTAGLVLFGAFIGTILLALVWVIVWPWLPGTGIVKGLVAMPVAVGIGTFALVDGRNPDFLILGHDPLVVASLVALIALLAPAMALVDGWLDRRLPHVTSLGTAWANAYVALTAVGGFFTALILATGRADPKLVPLLLIVVGVGIVTAIWWSQRLRGRSTPSHWLTAAARAILVIATALGFVVLIPELRRALGGA